MSKSEIGVELKYASYSWHEGAEPVLENITMKMKQGQMLTVFGEEAGSGKTSLLYALMQELTLISGSNEISGSIGFIEREPFMISDTILQNILFGRPFNESRLDEAAEASGLHEDLKHLSKGIETKVETGGTHLSPELKVRIGLARAIYAHSDLILIDDAFKDIGSEDAN